MASMKIQLLGTGAADGIPGLFSRDAISTYAREHGGREVRSRSAAVVDGILKIDLGPDTFHQVAKFGLCPMDWKALFFTHSDDDHIEEKEIQYALFPFTEEDHLGFTIFGNSVVSGIIRSRYPDWPLDIVETTSFTPLRFAEYEVTPIVANHIPGEDCHNLLFARDGKSLLYATDTGFWSEETFEFLVGKALDVLVLECTDGVHESTYEGHLNLRTFYETIERLHKSGAVTSNTKVASTHHSCRGGMRHCDLDSELSGKGIIAGYDGLILEI